MSQRRKSFEFHRILQKQSRRQFRCLQRIAERWMEAGNNARPHNKLSSLQSPEFANKFKLEWI
jgi:hypothetical protein